MANFLHRTTKQYLQSADPNGLLEPEANYIENPDLSAVTGQPKRYWIITGDVVTLMDQSAQDAIDAALLVAMRDSVTAQLDEQEDVLRAFMLAVLDEFNAHADKTNAILDAIDNANNLAGLKTAIGAITDYPARTVAQLRSTVRNKLGS